MTQQSHPQALTQEKWKPMLTEQNQNKTKWMLIAALFVIAKSGNNPNVPSKAVVCLYEGTLLIQKEEQTPDTRSARMNVRGVLLSERSQMQRDGTAPWCTGKGRTVRAGNRLLVSRAGG